MDNGKIKIAIITITLAGGGAERSSALLTVLFSKLGYEVHLVTVKDEIEYEYQGKLFNLGILKNKNDTIFGRFHRLIVFKKYLKENNFDWVIDNRTRTSWWSELIISRLIYNPKKTIYVVRSFNIQNYFPKKNWVARYIYKKSPYIIAVSNEIKKVIETTFKYKNVKTIYNYIDKNELHNLSENEIITEKFILAYGRIDDEIKNYSLLIDGYSQSNLPKINIPLYIIGDGKDFEKLKKKVSTLNLSEKIIFKGKMVNPFAYVKVALFTVLTSRYEGFPRVITESLALGTPVIAVDCQSGPKEIIQHEYNGLLIENYNPNELAKAMNRLVEDADLYETCKNNAIKSVEHLSLENISNDWDKILDPHKVKHSKLNSLII